MEVSVEIDGQEQIFVIDDGVWYADGEAIEETPLLSQIKADLILGGVI